MGINEREQKAILSILSSALFGNALELSDDLDWDALFQESIAQAVFPLVFDTVRDRLPGDVKRKWESRFLQNTATNIRVNAAHSELHKLLTKNAVSYVTLKGVASALYYPHPELRTMGDVDFLVDPHELERCGELLEKQGMIWIDDGSHPYHRSYMFHSIEYEMHWAPPGIPNISGEAIRDCCENMIEKAACVSAPMGELWVPSNFHHGLVLLLHTAGHMTSNGIGLRHLCDWAVFVNHFSDKEFCAMFEKTLQEIGLRKFANILTSIGTKYIAAPKKQWAEDEDEELVEWLFADIWASGNLGSKDSGRQGYTAILYENYIDNIKDRGLMYSIASLINRKGKEFYPRLTQYPVLLPLGWFGALGRYSKMILSGRKVPIKPGKEYKNAMKRRKVYQNLKLFENNADGEQNGR